MKMQQGIIGKSVCLTSVEKADLDYVWLWKNNINLLNDMQAMPMLSTFQDVINWYENNVKDKNQCLFAIRSLSDSSIIGIGRLMFINWLSGVAEMGIYIGNSEYLGKGLGFESTNLLLQYAFLQLNLRKVFLRVSSNNEVAVNLYKKMGFLMEGTQKKHFFSKGEYLDIHIMAIFSDQFNHLLV